MGEGESKGWNLVSTITLHQMFGKPLSIRPIQTCMAVQGVRDVNDFQKMIFLYFFMLGRFVVLLIFPTKSKEKRLDEQDGMKCQDWVWESNRGKEGVGLLDWVEWSQEWLCVCELKVHIC